MVDLCRRMADGFKSWKEFYDRMNLIFNGIIAVSLIPFGWLLLEMEARGNKTPLMEGESLVYLQLVLGLSALALIFSGYRYGVIQQRNLLVGDSVGIKLRSYYQVHFQKYMLYEGAALVALAGLYSSRSYLFVVIYVFVLFLFSLIRPTYDHVAIFLQLKKDEREKITRDRDLLK